MMLISTKDRLPEDETPVVIVRNGVFHIGERRWDHPNYEDTYPSYWYWDDPNNEGQEWERDEVTQWMPLPEVSSVSLEAGASVFGGCMCQPDGLMFDALGEPRKRYVRVTKDGSHCIMDALEGAAYLAYEQVLDGDSTYVVQDVWLSEREFDDLPEHDGF